MKTAIYIGEGVTQIVLTAETKGEESVLEMIREAKNLKVKRGSFYHCAGGYVRHNVTGSAYITMLVVKP